MDARAEEGNAPCMPSRGLQDQWLLACSEQIRSARQALSWFSRDCRVLRVRGGRLGVVARNACARKCRSNATRATEQLEPAALPCLGFLIPNLTGITFSLTIPYAESSLQTPHRLPTRSAALLSLAPLLMESQRFAEVGGVVKGCKIFLGSSKRPPASVNETPSELLDQFGPQKRARRALPSY